MTERRMRCRVAVGLRAADEHAEQASAKGHNESCWRGQAGGLGSASSADETACEGAAAALQPVTRMML